MTNGGAPVIAPEHQAHLFDAFRRGEMHGQPGVGLGLAIAARADTLLAIEMKRRYAFTCQVCRQPVVISTTVRYAEGHHLQPLGHPHFGPDVPGNIVVLCPNHHVMFDRGALTIVPETMAVRHVVDGLLGSPQRLYVEDWHPIDLAFLRYHHDTIFQAA